MNVKKVLMQMFVGVGVICTFLLWGFPVKATQVISIQQEENQIFLPLVQQSTLLPQRLYYIEAGQIYRMDRNGSTITQITSELEEVGDFGISSPADKIAYSAGTQLIMSDTNGENRQVLVSSDTNTHYFPHWSPDGKTIAYWNDDSVYFYDHDTGISTLVLGNAGDGETYRARDFSPDGAYLIVTIGQSPGNWGVYDIANETLVLLEPPEPFALVPCNCSPASWSADSNYIYISDFVAAGPTRLGLWRYTPDGTGTVLLDGSSTPNKATAPRQEPNDDMMYLYSSPETGIDPDAPFYLVRTAFDGVSNRVVLRPETFYASRVSLWTPDGSALVFVQSNGQNSGIFQNMLLIPVNPSLPIVTLLTDASTLGWQLQWGP